MRFWISPGMSNRLRLIIRCFLLVSWAALLDANSAALTSYASSSGKSGQSGENSHRTDSSAANAEEAHQRLVDCLRDGRLAEAVELGRDSVFRWPDDAEIRHLLGLAYFKIRQDPLAIQELQHAESLDDSTAAIHFDFALVYL